MRGNTYIPIILTRRHCHISLRTHFFLLVIANCGLVTEVVAISLLCKDDLEGGGEGERVALPRVYSRIMPDQPADKATNMQATYFHARRFRPGAS
jgi:hypothetical protein